MMLLNLLKLDLRLLVVRVVVEEKILLKLVAKISQKLKMLLKNLRL